MRSIAKGREPASLTAHRQKPHCDYDNYAEKDELRHALVKEQRGLCCYCMGRISSAADDMKIEHWRCQARYPTLQLNYRNILGSCRGGEGQPRDKQHCDTRKRNLDLLWNPADPEHEIEARILYKDDGTIYSKNPDFNRQLDDVLNLNLELLRHRRRSVLTGLLDWLSRENISRKRLLREKTRLTVGNGHLTPCCQVLVFWLDQLLERRRS